MDRIFLIAFVIAVVRLLFFGDYDVFPAIMDSMFSSSKTAFEISLGQTGVCGTYFCTKRSEDVAITCDNHGELMALEIGLAGYLLIILGIFRKRW